MMPQVERRRDGTVRLTFPYSRQLVEDIKATFMPYQRSYDPHAKAWTISAGMAPLAITLMRRYFGSDLLVTDDLAAEPFPPASDPTYATLHLLPSAPPELVRSAYRVLATIYHPDRIGGDGEQMRSLNASYDALRAKGVA